MQILLNGTIQGLLFALMGVAFSLVYSTTKTFHIALGGIYALAPYLLLACINAGWSPIVGILVSLGVTGGLGVLCEEVLHWPFTRKSAPPEIHLIGSLGMFLVIIQVIALIWGNDIQVLRAGVDQVFIISDSLRLTRAQLACGVGAALVLALFFFLLRKSDLGLQFRAMADNSILLSLLGKNVRRLRRLVFLGSAMLAAIAALASAYDTGFDPHGGLNAVLFGMVATIIGGRGSFFGAAVAGLLLGIVRSQVVWYGSSRWEEAATFLLLSLFLFVRPQGIFGRKLRLEEKA